MSVLHAVVALVVLGVIFGVCMAVVGLVQTFGREDY